MTYVRGARLLGFAMIAMMATAGAARAQITTGTVTGTVNDVQGGVIPGATVTLTNEAQGTKGAPVVTSAAGDFVLANVRAGTYTIEVTMPSFKALKRAGIVVNPGSRVTIGTLTLEIGGASE